MTTTTHLCLPKPVYVCACAYKRACGRVLVNIHIDIHVQQRTYTDTHTHLNGQNDDNPTH